MKKTGIILTLSLILLIPVVFALSLDITNPPTRSAMILGLDRPAKIDIEIKNMGSADNLIFYTFFTTSMFPKGTTSIAAGETKTVTLEFYPPENIKTSGYQTFNYYIKGNGGSEIAQSLTLNVVELKDAFEIGSSEINAKEETLTIYIHNKVNFDFKNMKVEFSSPFFRETEEFSLGPNQRQDFIIVLNKEDFKKLLAGYYTMNAKITVDNLNAELETPIKFIESNIVTETKKDNGFIINTKTITKTNEGNLVSNIQTNLKKNIVSRLFTTFSPEPDITERQGFMVYYTWNQEIQPGESSVIKVRTNWLLPFLLIIILLGVIVISKYYSGRNLVLKKRVSFVRAKGGEFALKVTVAVHAKKYLERVNITERLPPLVKIHEKFGTEVPSRVDEKGRKIEWRYDKLQQGETRVLSYILYSKIGVVGKFALPRTSALFEKEGKILERNSNRTFFMVEQDDIRRE